MNYNAELEQLSKKWTNGRTNIPILQNISPKTLKTRNTTKHRFVNWIGTKRHLPASKSPFLRKI